MAVADARDPQRAGPESLAPVVAVAALVVGDVLGERLGPVAGLGEYLDRVGDLFDLRVLELLAGLVGGQGGVRDQREQVGRVAGRRRLGGEPAARVTAHAAAGPRPPKSTRHHAVAVRARGRLRGGGRLGRRLGGWLVCFGGFALAHPGLGLAVGEDRPEVAPDRVGVHPRLVTLSEPLLGRRRDREQVGLALPAADRLDLPVAGADRQHDRRERRVQVGADPGGDAGALARVGVQRLQPGERAGSISPTSS